MYTRARRHANPNVSTDEGVDDEERAVKEAVLVPGEEPGDIPDDVGVDGEDDRRHEGDREAPEDEEVRDTGRTVVPGH